MIEEEEAAQEQIGFDDSRSVDTSNKSNKIVMMSLENVESFIQD